MSRSQRSKRAGTLIEDANKAVRTLIKQPVKEAVREALAEERAVEREGAETTSRGGESTGRGARMGAIWRYGFLAALAGIAYYAKQRRGIDIGEEVSQQVGTGGTERETGPSMEDPLSPEREGPGEETSEEGADGGPTSPS